MTIYKNQFSLNLLNSQNVHFECINGIFYLNHGDEYKICLKNNSLTQKANANIQIDGKSIGTFRLNKNDKIIIERPVDKARKFTFYDVESIEGVKSGLSANSKDIGTLKVVIDVEERPVKVFKSFIDSDNCLSSRSGGTGLSGSSSQTFSEAEHINTFERVILEAKMKLKKSDYSVFSIDEDLEDIRIDGSEFKVKKYIDTISRLETKLNEKDTRISRLEKALNEKNTKISELETTIQSERRLRNNFMKQLNSLINIEPL